MKPRADVGAEPVDVLLIEVEVDEAVVYGDADVKRLTGGRGELADGRHQREPGPHRALGVVLVRERIAEHRERPVALELHDVALEARLDDVAARAPVAAHDLAVRLGLEAAGELRRPDDVAEHDGEPAQLTHPGAPAGAVP